MRWWSGAWAAGLAAVAGWLVGYDLAGSAWHAALMGAIWAVVVLLLYRRIA